MKRWILLALLAVAGCGRPFDVKTAPGFVELENQQPTYEYRAVSPEGVVVAVRVVSLNDDQRDLGFWLRAIVLRMRQANGYALLETRDVQSYDGTRGKELRFGHDENGRPYVYLMRLFVAQGRLFIVEAGGSNVEMDRYKRSVDWTLASVRVKCDTIVSPVLASRTCNRW